MKDLGSLLVHPLFRRLGWTLVSFLWQGALVAVLLACVNSLLLRRRPGVRYAAACGALLLMAALPIATFASKAGGAVSVVHGAGSGAAYSAEGLSASHPRFPSVEGSPAAAFARF